MKLRADEIASVLKQEIAAFRREVDMAAVGRVLEAGDGIARIWGLAEAMAGEALVIGDAAVAEVFNLEEGSIGAAIYGPAEAVGEGDSVRCTGHLLEVPVGEEMLGRVVDPLGRPLDGEGPIDTRHTRPTEMVAPGIAARQPVNEPLYTGIKAIDSMIPIGRGQRELIIGDRRTGKTTIAVDTIINQAGGDVVCVYVAIGQKEAAVAGVVETLRSHGAMGHTIVVGASSAAPAPMQYLAPYAGCAIAEHFMYSAGRDTLIVYDDLTRHAAAYRQISLLLRRPPGREAYPGDIFYLHSRLLERACKLAEQYVIVRADTPEAAPELAGVDGRVYDRPEGRAAAEEARAAMKAPEGLCVRQVPGSGGSMTALPILETLDGEIAAYIPTNLISITDGQIYLVPNLFFAGIRPAINVGVSVSRVGAAAQPKAMRQVAKSLRLELAAYRELEAFSLLGTELGSGAQAQLDRGSRMAELLKQPQHQTMPIADQIIVIYAANKGHLDNLYLADVPAFEKELLARIKDEHAELYEAVEGDRLEDQTRKGLDEAIGRFRDGFQAMHRRRDKSAVAEGLKQN